MFYPGEYKIIFYDNATDLEQKLLIELDGSIGKKSAEATCQELH
jgi:hypothetical protein